MAPRAPKPKASTPASTLDDTSSITSLSPLKPKASKVEKPKSDKPKVTKAKAEKVEKVIKKEGVDKPKKETVKKEPKDVKKDGGGGGGGGAKKDAGKEKVKAVTGEDAEKLVKAYLREQNRPYSATEVSANLHGKVCFLFPLLCLEAEDEQVTKTVADKLLKEMEQSGAIMGKASNGEKKPGEKKGGQWVFWCLQVCISSTHFLGG
jgi:26S proteasome regulatory subunit, ATPase 3, interacting protein